MRPMWWAAVSGILSWDAARNNWDITTSASPEQVKALFHRTVDTGLQHGTVTVLMDREGFEVTTYRVDGDYEDGRHPKEVMFTASLEENHETAGFYHQCNGISSRPGNCGSVSWDGGYEKSSDPLCRRPNGKIWGRRPSDS